MPAPKGNKYWQLATNPGREKKYSPNTLWKKFNEYTQWIDENPFKEAVLVQKGIKVKSEGEVLLVGGGEVGHYPLHRHPFGCIGFLYEFRRILIRITSYNVCYTKLLRST